MKTEAEENDCLKKGLCPMHQLALEHGKLLRRNFHFMPLTASSNVLSGWMCRKRSHNLSWTFFRRATREEADHDSTDHNSVRFKTAVGFAIDSKISELSAHKIKQSFLRFFGAKLAIIACNEVSINDCKVVCLEVCRGIFRGVSWGSGTPKILACNRS